MKRLRKRYLHSDFHERLHVNKQRNTALVLIVTGILRSLAWITLMVLYLTGVHFTKSLFASVAFVAVISLYANAATDFGQVAASLAQLTAANVHHDVVLSREEMLLEISDIEKDIARLAALAPGPEAQELADAMQRRFVAERRRRHEELR